jgi:Helix-turn-helix
MLLGQRYPKHFCLQRDLSTGRGLTRALISGDYACVVGYRSGYNSCDMSSKVMLNLRIALWEAGITQGQLARDSGLRRERVSRIFNGRLQAGARDRRLIARALGLPISHLFRVRARAHDKFDNQNSPNEKEAPHAHANQETAPR